MRDWAKETEKRAEFIKRLLESAGASGIVYGNSGGKDSALVGVLCKKACDDTVGLIMPCGTKSNYGSDMSDALMVAGLYGIKTRKVDLTETAEVIKGTIGETGSITDAAAANIPPRLRMTALYAVAASENRLVAGTGNKSEEYVGYFTKWGDGACDFNPIADLTVTEVFEFLGYLGAPNEILSKPPSAGLFEGQTDESEMGITYREIDGFLHNGICNPSDMEIITRYHQRSAHKRVSPVVYRGD